MPNRKLHEVETGSPYRGAVSATEQNQLARRGKSADDCLADVENFFRYHRLIVLSGRHIRKFCERHRGTDDAIPKVDLRPRLGGEIPAATGGLAFLLLVTASLSHAIPCRAGGLLIDAPSFAALPGSSGSFNVVLVNDSTQDQSIGGVVLYLTLTGSAGNSILFTSATINTVAPSYIFSQSYDFDNGFTLYTNPLPDTNLMTFDTGDPVNGYAGFTVLAPGDTFGLANVSYSVSANANSRDQRHDLIRTQRRRHVAFGRKRQRGCRRHPERFDHRGHRDSRAVIVDAGHDRRGDRPGRDAGVAGPIASTWWPFRQLSNRWAGLLHASTLEASFGR